MSDDRVFTIEYEGRKTEIKEKYIKAKRWDIVNRAVDILMEGVAIDRLSKFETIDLENRDNLIISHQGTTYCIPANDLLETNWNIAYLAIEQLIGKTKND